MTSDEQLQKWLKGESVHMGTKSEGQCCPDFSCCRPDLLADQPEREAFVLAAEPERMRFLGLFLGRAFGNAKVHIAGAGAPE